MLTHFMILAFVLISIGYIGLCFNRKNTLGLLMCLELVLLGINTLLIAFASALGDVTAHVWIFMILAVTAAEAAIGLAILVALWRSFHTIDMMKIMSQGD